MLVALYAPTGIERRQGGAAAPEKQGSRPARCLRHGLAAPRRLAASCTAPPEARHGFQEPPVRPQHARQPRERCVGGESVMSTLGKWRLGPALPRGSLSETLA